MMLGGRKFHAPGNESTVLLSVPEANVSGSESFPAAKVPPTEPSLLEAKVLGNERSVIPPHARLDS